MRAGWARIFFLLGISKGWVAWGFLVRKKKCCSNWILLLHVLTPNNDGHAQCWDGFSWWFWTRAFSSHEHTFWYGLFVLFCLFKTFLLLISLPWMWLGRGAWQPYEISHAHDRRSIGKKRIITYGLDENRSAIFKAWKQGIRKRARNYKLKDLQKKEAGGCFERQENKKDRNKN